MKLPQFHFGIAGNIVIGAAMLAPFCGASAVEVLPVLNANDQIYTNVTVTKVTATDIYFTNQAGMANAKLKGLDPKLRKHFHYNAARAKAAEQQQATNAALYHLQLLHAFPQPVWPGSSGSQTNPPAGSAGQSSQPHSYLNPPGTGFIGGTMANPGARCAQ